MLHIWQMFSMVWVISYSRSTARPAITCHNFNWLIIIYSPVKLNWFRLSRHKLTVKMIKTAPRGAMKQGCSPGDKLYSHSHLVWGKLLLSSEIGPKKDIVRLLKKNGWTIYCPCIPELNARQLVNYPISPKNDIKQLYDEKRDF